MGGVIIGGLITIFTSIYTAKKNYDNNFALLKTQEELETKATIKAIIAELHALKQIFDIEFIPKIFKNEECLWYAYPLGTDYFTIFNANTAKIGKINNDELRECIINIYMTAKFFLDCIATNNEAIEYYEKCYNNVYAYSYDEVMPQSTPKQKDDLLIAKDRLIHSKKNNLVPTCEKMVYLFEQLENILQK